MRWLLLIFLMLSLPVTADNFDLCRVFQQESQGNEGLFDSAGYHFIDMPADLQVVDYLWISDPEQGGQQVYALYYSPSRRQLWVFAFWSLALRDDGKDNHYGAHDFCYPVRWYELEP